MMLQHDLFQNYPEVEARSCWIPDSDFILNTGASDAYAQYESIFKRAKIGRDNLAAAEQIHGNGVQICHTSGTVETCDGLITQKSGLSLSIRTADCVAILIYDPLQKVAANIHAGWRGLHSKILFKTINDLRNIYNCLPRQLLVSVSPFIKKCCYQVGLEFKEKFSEKYLIERNDGIHLDTEAVLLSQLSELEVAAHNINISPHCTHCSDLELPSFRKTKTKNRMIHLITLKGGK